MTLRVLTTAEIRQAIESHNLWLKGDMNGCQARFKDCIIAEEDLKGARLRKAWFDNVRFDDVDFEDADLSNALFTDVVMHRCNLAKIHAENVVFERAKVDGCTFDHAYLENADFRRVEASKASFLRAYLVRANFREATLTYTNFRWASCNGACFDRADMRWANLEEGSFINASMWDVDFFQAKLSFAKMKGVGLWGSALPFGHHFTISTAHGLYNILEMLKAIYCLECDGNNDEYAEFQEIVRLIKPYVEKLGKS